MQCNETFLKQSESCSFLIFSQDQLIDQVASLQDQPWRCQNDRRQDSGGFSPVHRIAKGCNCAPVTVQVPIAPPAYGNAKMSYPLSELRNVSWGLVFAPQARIVVKVEGRERTTTRGSLLRLVPLYDLRMAQVEMFVLKLLLKEG